LKLCLDIAAICTMAEAGTVAVVVDAPQHAGMAAALAYASEQPLAPGSLVRVPLGRRVVPGIVWDGAADAPPEGTELRAVADALTALPPLPAAWLHHG
jgi:primosomal protein N' (replication factor Y) (superfamily II helicase)